MKIKHVLLCGALLASAGITAGNEPVHAGDCYVDPVYERAWTGKIVVGARVRDGACMEGTVVLTTLPVGTTVNIIAETDGWLKVQLPSGTKGWVGATLISVTDRNSTGNNESSESAEPDPNAQPVTEPSPAPTPVPVPVSTDVLSQRLRGYILLQVQQNGEAWYVHPDDGKRFYMKDGQVAYEMMRQFGLGISDKDFTSLKNGNLDLNKRLRGKIVLMVQQHGEAYYIHPVKGTLHYLKNGEEAYKIMRELSLGITDKDLAQIAPRDFDAYVQEKLEAKESATTPLPVSGTIALKATVENGKVYLTWATNAVDVSMGFKVVWSNQENPVYPGNDYHYLSESATRADAITGLAAGTYYVRVCQYLGGKCGVYSNNVKVTIGSTGTTTTNETTEIVDPAGVDLNELNSYWLGKINALRAEKGLRQLVSDDRWVMTAMEWATYMGENNVSTHTRPDGKTMHQWIDTKGLPFTVRYSEGGWNTNYFTENISWGYSDGSMESLKQVMNDTLSFYLSEAATNGPHYRTIYHPDWNSVGMGVYLRPDGDRYKVFLAFHYGSLVLPQ